ncbi:MAG: glycosyltransferase family 4 protein [Pseudomonadota bacterium]
MDIALASSAAGISPVRSSRRFDRVAVTCVFGHPRDARSWSGAPANVSAAMERLGVTVEAIRPRLSRMSKAAIALRGVLSGYGLPASSEEVLRSIEARRAMARDVAEQTARLGVSHVLHTGTLDLPACDLGRGVRHYLYCDHSWALAARHHVHAHRHNSRARRMFEDGEREALSGLSHVFTFGSYVRDNLISHYQLPPDRVTAVGSGMGSIEPWFGKKDYTRPALLFVAKHLFRAKGGVLLLEAFALARRERPDLSLTIVGDERSRAFLNGQPGVVLRAHLPWAELQQLYRDSTLLVQPMLNDPWGQVYLEAMVSRTPVVGLRRNALPELLDGGRHGFLVDQAEPAALARTIIDALADPARLEDMAQTAQSRVLASYSWDRVAERIVFS